LGKKVVKGVEALGLTLFTIEFRYVFVDQCSYCGVGVVQFPQSAVNQFYLVGALFRVIARRKRLQDVEDTQDFDKVWGVFDKFSFQTGQVFKKIGIKDSNSFVVFFETILTLFIVLLTWIFFRSESISQSFAYLSNMFSAPMFEIPSSLLIMNLLWGALLLVAEWIQRDKQHALQFDRLPVYARWCVYYAIIILILFRGGQQETFIYFQF